MDSTTRFSDRVDDYVRWRPGYPRGVVDALEAAGALRPASVVVDLGSGTGLLSRVFLETGHAVIGVEPNGPMRAAGDRELTDFPRFSSRDGTAEATGLEDRCADLVSAGQAFHWFDPERTRVEARRILRPGGVAALVWNDRDGTSPFLSGYEALLRTLPAYAAVRRPDDDGARTRAWFASCRTVELEHRQRLPWIGLRGRFLSASYAPKEDDPSFPQVEAHLRRLFEAHARDGLVEVPYVTRVYFGAP